MRKSIRIMGRMELPHFAEPTSPVEPPPTYTVDLEDPRPLREYLHNLGLQASADSRKESTCTNIETCALSYSPRRAR